MLEYRANESGFVLRVGLDVCGGPGILDIHMAEEALQGNYTVKLNCI